MDRVLITVTGRDRAGITAKLTGILSKEGATLRDIVQVGVQGQLTLCLLVGLPHARDVLKELLFTAKEMGLELDFNPVTPDAPTPSEVRGASAASRRYVITAIGRSLGASAQHALAETLATETANIEKISRLSEDTLAS